MSKSIAALVGALVPIPAMGHHCGTSQGKVLCMRVARNVLVFVLGLFIIGPGNVLAQALDASLYRNLEYRFAAIFPDTPQVREISYLTKDDTSVLGRQFYVEQGTNHYIVTVVNFPAGPAIDYFAVEHAAEQMRLRGEIRFEFDMAYDPGIPGRQLNILQPDGRQLRVSTYMWEHNLYIAEAIAQPGDAAALKLEQSLLLLDSNGDAVDTGSGNCPIPTPE
jgi:hypothetical protein